MRSGTSFFDKAVFKKTICRFWPLWGGYFAIWLVLLPLTGLMMLRMEQTSRQYGVNANYMESFATSRAASAATEECLILMAVVGVLAAMAVFSHLYNARSANLFGSLPIRREGLFTTHYLAGLAFLVVPNVVIFLLTLLVELAGGWVCMQGLLFWLAVVCGEGFFFYSMAVFCAMFTGHLLALPAFYAIFNFIIIGLTHLLRIVFQAFYHGFAGFTDQVYAVVRWFTPAARLEEAVHAFYYRVADPQLLTPENLAAQPGVLVGDWFLEFHGLGTVGIYAIVAVILTVCAFFLYRARRLESAGDVVSVKALRPVFKYGVALCTGLALGLVTTMFTGGREAMLMVAIVVWGVIGYFAAEMLLQKSFRVFKKWKGAAAVTAVFIALFLVVGFDLTGFETRIPDPASVDSVYVSGINVVYLQDDGDRFRMEISDPEVIRLVNILHQEAVAQRDLERQAQAQIGGAGTSLGVTYRLKGGGTLAREYTVWVKPDEVNQEGSPAWALQQLYDNHELYWEAYGFTGLEACLAQGGRLDSAALETYDERTGMSEDAYFYGSDGLALLAAVKEDFFAGRIGVRRVEDAGYYNPYPEKSIRFSASGEDGSYYIHIALQDTASSTLAALDEMADRAVTSDSYDTYDWGYYG